MWRIMMTCAITKMLKQVLNLKEELRNSNGARKIRFSAKIVLIDEAFCRVKSKVQQSPQTLKLQQLLDGLLDNIL